MENFKLFSYGFIHFKSQDSKDEFFQETKDKRFHLKESVIVQFHPIKRNTEPQYKHVIC